MSPLMPFPKGRVGSSWLVTHRLLKYLKTILSKLKAIPNIK
jgi:hypothetical protein